MMRSTEGWRNSGPLPASLIAVEGNPIFDDVFPVDFTLTRTGPHIPEIRIVTLRSM